MEIKFEQAKSLKEKPTGSLGFGKYYTDYMFVCDWDQGIGWHDARIVPYAPLQFDPASMVLHYAQETFEGLKAYRRRPRRNRVLIYRRFETSGRQRNLPSFNLGIHSGAVRKD